MPPVLVVPPGTTVTWQNDDGTPHRLVGEGFDTGVMQPFDTFSFTFPAIGDLAYGDALHRDDARFRGRVVVRAGAVPPPEAGSDAGSGGGTRVGTFIGAGGAGGPGTPLSSGLVTALVIGVPLALVLVSALALRRTARSSPREFGSNELGPDT